MTSYSIAKDLFLVDQRISRAAPPKPVETNTNHVLVFDCSGSMYNSLPEIRSQIKNKLPTLARPGDTVTIIWFSGRDQFGVLIENFKIETIADFNRFNMTVDRWLRPMGLTGFKQPLQEVGKVVTRIGKNGLPFSMFFLTDGYDNCWRESEILDECDRVGAHVQSCTIVEYGYYCNRPLLTKMAERIGGTLIFSESLADYMPVFESAVQRRPLGGKKVTVEIESDDVVGDLVWTFDGNPTVYRLADGDVTLSEGYDRVSYLSRKPVGEVKPYTKGCLGELDAYVGLAVFAQRMNSDMVLHLLKATGDVRFIAQFGNCFGKQSYSTFQKDVLAAANDPALRMTQGYDPNKVPDENAFTILDVLAILALDDGNKFYPRHPEFGYERIGRKTETATAKLTEAEQTEIDGLMAKAKTKADLAKVQERLNEIVASKPVELKFTEVEANPGVEITKLTTNETRPNISILVQIDGTVDLTPLWEGENAKKLEKAGVPRQFPTFINRNYSIIADGIVNTKKLPVSLTEKTFKEFVAQGLISLDDEPLYSAKSIYLIDLTHIPTVNRRMIKEASAKKLFEAEFQKERLSAGNKVIGDALKALGGTKTSEGIAAKYGTEVAELLALNGIKDYGFSPKTVLAEATDTYMGKELKSSMKGLSSLPKVADVREKVAKKAKLTISQQLIAEWLPVVDKYEATITDKAKLRDALDKALKANREESRKLGRILNEQKFAVVVGQVWFKEFESLDQNQISLNTDLGEVTCTVELQEKEFKR